MKMRESNSSQGVLKTFGDTAKPSQLLSSSCALMNSCDDVKSISHMRSFWDEGQRRVSKSGKDQSMGVGRDVIMDDYARRKSFGGRGEFWANQSTRDSRDSNVVGKHSRLLSEETFEYSFDKCYDKFLLMEEKPAQGKDASHNASFRDKPVSVVDAGRKEETFEERALRFGIEDWNLVDKKWRQSSMIVSKHPARRGAFHSPSGSDSSSLVSTLDSSSFSCGSEGSSFVIQKGELSPASVVPINAHVVPAMMLPVPLSSIGPGGRQTDVEKKIVDARKAEPKDLKVQESDLDDGSFLEFNFLDGKMVETQEVALDIKTGVAPLVSRFGKEEDICEDFPTVRDGSSETSYHSALIRSPESESFFGSSQDFSDFSGTHSAINGTRHGVRRDESGALHVFDDVSRGYLDDRDCSEEWADHKFFDFESTVVGPKTPPNSASKGSLKSSSDSSAHASKSSSTHETVAAQVKLKSSRSSKSETAFATKPPGVSRRARSLGSVISQHLAFSPILASGSISNKIALERKPSLKSGQWEGDSPAKSAACIDWLWSEKSLLKQSQGPKGVLGDRDTASSVSSLSHSSTVRSLELAFRETRSSGKGRSRNGGSKASVPETPKPKVRVSLSPVRVWKDVSKDPRASILASWNSVYGESMAVKYPKVAPTSPVLKKGSKASVLLKKPTNAPPVPTSNSKYGLKLPKVAPKQHTLEMEVLCRPFGPVLKSTRCLPTPGPTKRSTGKSPLFSSIAFKGENSQSCSTVSSPVVVNKSSQSIIRFGKVQCVLGRDGLPSYSLIMDETEEIFVAKTLRIDTPAGVHEGITHMYSFHSYKEKAKGKSGWRSWGKKEKPSSDFAGKMRVSSTICPVVSCSGVQNFLETEFVLYDARCKEISISGPTTSSPGPRSSVSSWDTTPLRSPRITYSTFSSPSSAYFSLPSPATGTYSSPGAAPSFAMPSRYVSLSMPAGSAGKSRDSSFGASSRSRPLDRNVSLDSPYQHNVKLSSCAFQEVWSDSEPVEDAELRSWNPSQSMSEIAAVVVRVPMEKLQQEKSLPAAEATGMSEKWGWGINFLKKSSDRFKTNAARDDEEKLCSPRASEDGAESCTGSGQSCRSCRHGVPDVHSKWGLNVTMILPAGDHGCSTNGMEGPQPLVERWKSGGKCDCGNWDLGCGLTIVDHHRLDPSCSFRRVDFGEPTGASNHGISGRNQQSESLFKLFVQGKLQETLGFSLNQLHEGLYTLGFQSPVSPLHAFATAVAILHSRDPVFPTKRAADVKRRVPRVPVKVIPSSNRSFSRPIDESFGLKPMGNYQRACCPDPPLSPIGRA